MRTITTYDLPSGLYFEKGYIDTIYGTTYYVFKSSKKNRYIFQLQKNKLTVLFEKKPCNFSKEYFKTHSKRFHGIFRCEFLMLDENRPIYDNTIIELLTSANKFYSVIYNNYNILNKLKEITHQQYCELLINFPTYTVFYVPYYRTKLDCYHISRIMKIKNKRGI